MNFNLPGKFVSDRVSVIRGIVAGEWWLNGPFGKQEDSAMNAILPSEKKFEPIFRWICTVVKTCSS